MILAGEAIKPDRTPVVVAAQCGFVPFPSIERLLRAGLVEALNGQLERGIAAICVTDAGREAWRQQRAATP